MSLSNKKLLSEVDGIMLTGTLMVMINNLFQKSFDITFMKNEKNCQNINNFFFYKNFL